MTPWVIEPLVSSADIDGILQVEEASFTNPWTREMYEAELRNEGTAFFYLARDNTRRVVGFCSCWHVADELHINNLAVLPEFRNQQIGSTLLTHVLAHGQRLGATRALLEVRQSNQPARRLYERFGFSVSGIRREYYSQPVEDAVVLWRELPGIEKDASRRP
jgi:[ribosomal protein S18]-alanine N-acetyltransferase